MKCNFIFKPVEHTFSDPIAAVFKPGTPFGREYSRGDIVLLHPEISSSKVYLNSLILRTAILESREYLEEKLGLIIQDKNEVKETNIKKESKTKSKKEKQVIEEDPLLEKLKKEEPVIDEEIVTPIVEEDSELVLEETNLSEE